MFLSLLPRVQYTTHSTYSLMNYQEYTFYLNLVANYDRNINMYDIISSYRAGSTDIPDPLSPLLPIVHRPR